MSNPIYQFDDYEIIAGRRELRCRGQSLPIEPKVYDLLVYLLEHRDRSVSKDELQDAIWPRVIVTEGALSRCVMKARQTVGDSANRQRVIKTVHSHGYRFVAEVVVRTPDAGAPRAWPAPESDRIRLAVMPFQNLSSDSEQEYLAEGLTQDVITDLSRNPWLIVSAGAPAAGDRDYRNIAAELGVRYVVEGSVRRSASHVRVTASLVDADSGAREWSERYDRPITDFFAIQDDISRGIASSLGSHVRRAEGRRAELADPQALDAWGLIHRGMSESWSKFNRASNAAAEALYRQALRLSPQNPKALAFMASSLAMKVANGWSSDIAGDSQEAWRLGAEATSGSPEDPMILSHWGHLHTCLGKASTGVGILERARELDPSSAWTLGLLAYALTGAGRAQEALGKISQALQMSPRDAAAHWYLAMYAFAYLQLAQYDDAAREAQRSINSFSGWQPPWATLAVALAGVGQWQEARVAASTAARLEPMVGCDGYRRFFRFVVRDEAHSGQLDAWLNEIWPDAPARVAGTP